MSQHHFMTVHEGRPVNVLLGWDRPLGGFFLVIEREDVAGAFLYCNLDDPDLTDCGGLPASLDHFKARLAGFGLSVPAAMWGAVQVDGAINRGNYVARYDASGNTLGDTVGK